MDKLEMGRKNPTRKSRKELTGLAWPTAKRAAATNDAVFMMICLIQVN